MEADSLGTRLTEQEYSITFGARRSSWIGLEEGAAKIRRPGAA